MGEIKVEELLNKNSDKKKTDFYIIIRKTIENRRLPQEKNLPVKSKKNSMN